MATAAELLQQAAEQAASTQSGSKQPAPRVVEQADANMLRTSAKSGK